MPSDSKSVLKIDFTAPKFIYRLKNGGGIKQDLARACGLKSGIRPYIFDATAGLGRDSFILAHLGCNVKMMEHNHIVFIALKEALSIAMENEFLANTASRIELICGDSVDFLKKLDKNHFDTIYLDPMFPKHDKSALVKKEMQILQEVTTNLHEEGELLEAALGKAKRIAIKRAKTSPLISGKTPDAQIKGKSNRFDIYIR